MRRPNCRKHSFIAAVAAGALIALAAACATPPTPVARIDARPLETGPNEVLEIDHLLLILDASASIPP